MENLVREVAGENYNYAWTGEAYQETQSGTTISLVLIFAIVMTLLVLAAQYESRTDPVAVIMAMPTALLGTVMGCIKHQYLHPDRYYPSVGSRSQKRYSDC